MKKLDVILGMLTCTTANSQAVSPTDSMEAQIDQQIQQRPSNQRVLVLPSEKPNEIKFGNITYSGITIQLAKPDNPLHLINPAAPPQYGSPEDNVTRDPINGKISGLKIFSVNF